MLSPAKLCGSGVVEGPSALRRRRSQMGVLLPIQRKQLQRGKARVGWTDSGSAFVAYCVFLKIGTQDDMHVRVGHTADRFFSSLGFGCRVVASALMV